MAGKERTERLIEKSLLWDTENRMKMNTIEISLSKVFAHT